MTPLVLLTPCPRTCPPFSRPLLRRHEASTDFEPSWPVVWISCTIYVPYFYCGWIASIQLISCESPTLFASMRSLTPSISPFGLKLRPISHIWGRQKSAANSLLNLNLLYAAIRLLCSLVLCLTPLSSFYIRHDHHLVCPPLILVASSISFAKVRGPRGSTMRPWPNRSWFCSVLSPKANKQCNSFVVYRCIYQVVGLCTVLWRI